MSDERPRITDAGIEIEPVYGAGTLEGFDPARDLGEPGAPPFTRGVYPSMYRGRLWTMRQYAGMGTAEETNARFRYLLDKGQTGLSVAFDLPTQMGLDSDHPRAEGEAGRTGVAIDSVEDMRRLFDQIPLDQVTTSMTINATAAILLLLYELVAEEQGVAADALGGTVQNDILKEYAARGTYIYPPQPSMRLVTDLFAYCRERIPRWNTISISGYHMREAGATLTAQQPENNIVRTALEGLSAVLGGTQSLHTNSFDEALALPTEHAAKIALRTQQVIGYESGVADTVDPLAGSYFVESLTSEVEARAWEFLDKIDGMGGSVAAIEAGWMQDEIHESAFRVQQGIEDGSRVIVGVNRWSEDDDAPPELQRVDPDAIARQVQRLAELRAMRDQAVVDRALATVVETARGTGNLLHPMREALRLRATLGEVSEALRGVFGEYRPPR
ncbi:MAG: methylmalonyl-CoA mutase family protein [Actinobacteria bacterium]|nr:methylmalonyl-CoA mutase family protein [Actinomycetota bacterium]